MTSTTSYDSWEFYNNRVQQETRGGQFVSAETTLIAAGRPTITSDAAVNGNTASGEVYPIGLLESFGLQQNKQLQRIFEIGSSRSYFIPGRVIGSISLGRTFYHGPSLLRVLYAYYSNSSNSIDISTKDKGTQIDTDKPPSTKPDPLAALLTKDSSTEGNHKLKRAPGADYFFIDLASDLFSQPTGMAVYFKDYNSDTIGAFYLQECYVQGHQMNISSGSVLVMEGAQLQYDTLVPIKMVA